MKNKHFSIVDYYSSIKIFFIVSFFVMMSTMEVMSQTTHSISGKVLDQDNKEVISFANVSLIRSQNKSLYEATQTSETGSFQFKNVPSGNFIVSITFMGYESLMKEVSISSNTQNINLGNLYLVPSGETLEEVTIVASTPPMQLAVDRKIFNVAESTLSLGGNATDLLANIPSLEVDMDGSVALRGASNVKILIDGKESAMAGSNITQLLQSLPANSIERVEIVTNPSSKYDAEGQSGIINIVMKKNLRLGFNGNVDLSAGSYDNYGAGVNLNFRDYKFNYFGGYNFNRRNNVGGGFNSTRLFQNNSLTNNETENSRLGLNHTIKLGVDYYMNDLTTIGVSGNVSLRDNERIENIFYTYQNHPSFQGNSERESVQEEDDLGYDLNLDFTRNFRENKGSITANLGFGYNSEEGENSFNQVFFQDVNLGDRRLNIGSELGRNFNAQIDFTHYLNDYFQLEYGFRSYIRESDDHQFSLTQNDAGVLVPDYFVSNDFKMLSQVHGLYGNFQHKITETFGYQVGLRAEQAYLDTDYIGLDPNINPEDQTAKGKLDYFRIYPSVYLTQQIGESNQLQLSYSRRVNRPRGWQVNPFIDISDPLNISQGNPNLKPEDIHSMELSYANFWNRFMLTSSVYHRIMNDIVQPIITEVDGQDGATFSQWQNVSSRNTTGFELISKVDITKDLDFTANFNANYTDYKGSPEFNIAPTSGFSWNANVSGNYRITPNISAQAKFDYRAPRIMAQGKTVENYVLDAGVRWDLMNKKASIMFNVRDLLNQRMHGGYTQTEQLYRYYENRWNKRTFGLTFTYRFGIQDSNKHDRGDMGFSDGPDDF